MSPGLPCSPGFALALLVVIVAVVCAAPIGSPRTVAVLALLTVALPVATRLSPRRLARRLAPLAGFMAMAALLSLIMPVPEEADRTTVRVLGRDLPASGVQFVAALALKSVVVLAVSLSLTHGLRERELLEGLIALRIPRRTASLCYLIVRSISSVSEETRRLMRARDSRGRPKGLRAVRVAGAMSGVLMVRLARRADTQAMALASRGFTGRFPLLDVRFLGWTEGAALLVVAAALAWLLLP